MTRGARSDGGKQTPVPFDLGKGQRRRRVEGGQRDDVKDQDSPIHYLNGGMTGSNLSDAIEAEVSNALGKLRSDIEDRTQFTDIGLKFPGGRASPKSVVALADDAVRRLLS